MEGKQITIKVEDPDEPPKRPPPPPPPKKMSRPKITLSIPDAPLPTGPRLGSGLPMTPRGPPGQMYWGPVKYHGKPPTTPASHVSDPHTHPYYNPFMHMYHNKASDFMFKQFEGFKDFTMNTAKSGLSAGEKSAFWFYNKLRTLSKKWFTHLFLTLCLVLYSVLGAMMFMALEGTQDKHQNVTMMNLTRVREDVAIEIEEQVNRILTEKNRGYNTNVEPSATALIEDLIKSYEQNFTECQRLDCENPNRKKTGTWGFWNAMFYAGTIYTTIGAYQTCGDKVVMSEGGQEKKRLSLQIPIIKAESETQTTSLLVPKSPDKFPKDMESEEQRLSLRKRRNLSKNRGQGARQREKTPEPGRTPIHEDTPTSEDEDPGPQRNSREIEADNTYEEMKRLVLEKANDKDPVYDLDTDEVLEQRALAANERRRRSISPFAVPNKEADEGTRLERKGSFIDPTNKLLSTNYTLSPKDEDSSKRRNSLTIESPTESRGSLSPPSTTNVSPKDKNAPCLLPTTPKKLEEIVYPDNVKEKVEDKPRNLKTPVTKESVFTFDEKDVNPPANAAATPNTVETPVPTQTNKTVASKAIETPAPLVKAATPKPPETPAQTGELVTKVIQVERTPSKKLSQDSKPVVEIRERIVRTPSRKLSADIKPVLTKQPPPKPAREEPQSKMPPVKPVRSKSATRFGNKTSESEMSEDQANHQNIAAGGRRKVIPTPRRFIKNRSPRANRSQSVAKVEDLKVVDKTGTEMTQTGKEIIELMQKARARSLSIPKDDPRLPPEYRHYSKTLQTPQNKTPISRTSRGISCPKTIQIISDKEILSGIAAKKAMNKRMEPERPPRRSSGYIDASQSEYTSSCYSSSPSENEYDFDLSEKTAELTRKLKQLSQEVDVKEDKDGVAAPKKEGLDIEEENTSGLRKRSVTDAKNGVKKERKESIEDNESKKVAEEKNITKRSRWKIVANWQQFKQEQSLEYRRLVSLRNRCICELLLLVILFGLGGLMFKSLEGSFENAYKCGTRNVKRDFIESLWRGSHYLREEDWKSMARKKLYEFENQLHTAHEAGVTSYSGQRSWNFMNSFVYSMTLVTTIGYGHIAPKTLYGRVATIVYAIIGIPLFLIVLADFGKLFTRIIKFFWAYIRRFYYTRSCRKVRRTVPMQEVMKGLNIVYDVVRRPSQIFAEEDMEEADNDKPPTLGRKPSDVPPPLPPKPGVVVKDADDLEPDTPAPSVFEIDDEFNLPISVAIFILIVYIIIGAIIFNIWEDWNFFECFYFVFISMSTIGLGDLVPDHPIFMMASILYLVFGLALTSMCINVVQVKLSDTFKQASAKIGATIGLKVAEEDGSLVPITPEPTEIAPVHKGKAEKLEKDEAKDTKEIEAKKES